MDGQLSDRERARIQAHLKICSDCREELRTLSWTQSLARQMPAMPVPRSFIVRQADLEARHIAQPRPLLVPTLARLQTAAAIVAVLLVVAITGDVFVGRRLLGRQSARTFSEEAPGPAPATLAVAQVPEEMPAAPSDEQTDSVANPPEIMLMAVATETLTVAIKQMVAPTLLASGTTDTIAEPSPTLLPRPTRAPTQAGHPADETSTQNSPTPAATATLEPTQTPTLEPTHTPIPAPTAAAALTITPPPPPTHTPNPEQQNVAQVQDTLAPATIEREDLGSGDELASQPAPRGPWQGWRITQIGLGVVLVGLLIAILWLRRWGRLG